MASRVTRSFQKKFPESKRKYLDKLAIELGVKQPHDWGKISMKDIQRKGAGRLLKSYGNSIRRMLCSVYPEIDWRTDWFHLHRYFWSKKENQKNFFDEIAIKFNIRSPSDWGKLSIDDMKHEGGAGLFSIYQSPFHALGSIYPEVEWNPYWFTKVPGGYWKQEQQRIFFDSFAKKHGINQPSEWGSITLNALLKEGKIARTILSNNNESLFECLKTAYPEIDWKMDWFNKASQRYWDLVENQREFMNQIANSLKIKDHKEWGRVPVRVLYHYGAQALLSKYERSTFKLLQNVFPEIKWKQEWFPNIPKYSFSFWERESNQRVFLQKIALNYGLDNPSDWRKITLSLIKNKGGKGFLSKYGNSLSRALLSLYPNTNWSSLNSKSQIFLQERVKLAFNTKKRNKLNS